MQPCLFQTNADQTIFLVASPQDCLYIDVKRNIEVDMDDEHNLKNFNTILFDAEDNQIYIIANKLNGELGFFILRLEGKDPYQKKGVNQFIVKWPRKLDIDDCHINILKDSKRGYKEVVVSYKTIFVNIYTILVLDLNHKSGQPLMYRHESFQLWESPCYGTLLSTQDFVTINKEGVNVIALGSTPKKLIKDSNKEER